MNIYQESGYLDIRKIYKVLISMGIWFLFMIGGRGTGKTYGTLEMVVEDRIKFLLMRRTQTETDLINIPEMSPFKKLNSDKDWNIDSKKISKNNAGLYYTDGVIVAENAELVGYTCALSTLASMRGFDASDVKILIYDEFIKEKSSRPIKHEATAFFNAIETINRNRELEGYDPIFVMALANSNDLGNDIFIELALVNTLIKMRQKGNEVYINKDRGLAVIDVQESEISERKSRTALYKLTKGTEFRSMAIDNSFNRENASTIKSKPLKEYKPLVMVGELCIYQHKHRHEYYVTTHKIGNPPTFGMGEVERARFIRTYNWIWAEYMEDNIEFENETCEILLTKVFK